MTNEKKEQIALNLILDFFQAYDFEVQFGENENGTFVMVHKDMFSIGIAMTVCNVYDKRVFKIEEINLNKELRGKGLGTFFISIISHMCKLCDLQLGLWTEGQPNLDKWYKDLGFKFVEINENTGHYWYEKEPNDSHMECLRGKIPKEAYETFLKIQKTSIRKYKMIEDKLV